jgi:hypothetical protein
MTNLSTNYTTTIESIHQKEEEKLSTFDALQCNDDCIEDTDNVACSLEYEIVDTEFETTFATPLRGQQNDL